MKRLREFIPGALATAARGDSTTAVAAEIAESLSAVGLNQAGLEHSVEESAAAVRQAAVLGTRSAESAETALSSLRSVRLDALLHDLPPVVRRTPRNSGRGVEFTHEPTNVEIDAARADEVAGVLKACVHALAGLAGPGRRRAGRAGRVDGAPASRLLLFAHAAGSDLFLRLSLSGGAPGAEQLHAALSAVRKRVERAGGSVESETRRGEGASVLLTILSAAVVASRSAEFVFARAGDTWYALPASAVIECIQAGMSVEDYELDGTRLATLRMNDTRDPREGVVVQTPRGGALLLFDSIGDREVALQTTGGGDSGGMAGISGSVRLPDGSTARLVDLAVLLPEPAHEKGGVISSRRPGHARERR